MSPIQVDPKNPVFPIAYPDEFSKSLAQKIGYYHTLGMPEETNAFCDYCLSADAFLEDCACIMREREQMLFTQIEKFKDGVFAFVFDTTDRIQHVFWSTLDRQHPIYDVTFAKKYGNVIFDYYLKMDKILRELLRYVDDKTVLIIVSDHGFTTFRRAVHVNSWLAQNGFLSLKSATTNAEGDPLFKNVDWEKTKAYALALYNFYTGLGFASIYVNLKGREGKGIINKGSEEEEVKQKITEGLKNLKDASKPVIEKVYDGNVLYSGTYAKESPDLIIGFRPGYRTSWQTAIGGAPNSLIDDNKKRWSGDHLIDPKYVPGIFFMNQKTSNQHPTILDIAPTVLSCFEIPIPEDMEGVALN